jgi:hypothetical protein
MKKNKKIKKTLCIIAAGILVKILGFIILTTFLGSSKKPLQNKKVEVEHTISKVETLVNYIKPMSLQNMNLSDLN